MERAVDDTIDQERILQSPPAVLPVPNGVKRPLWSVMIPVYNCSQFLKQTLEDVLSQAPAAAEMQIEVVDDASTDADVEQIVKTIGNGRISYYRQPVNVGSLRNFLTCLNRATGQFIHLLHGDDRIGRGFYSTIGNLFSKYDVGAAFCRYSYIDEEGQWLHNQSAEQESEGVLENFVETLCERQRIQYVAMAVRREVYEQLGGFYGAEYGEDWEMWVRIAANYRIGYTPEILASYRRHRKSISGKSFVTGRNMQELTWVMNRIQRYLPAATRESIMRKCRTFYAHYAITIAKSLWIEQRHRRGAEAQIRAAWNMQKDLSLFYRIMKLFTRMTLNI
jgi:glycosyltransferase involved in cell wall biosynthesis